MDLLDRIHRTSFLGPELLTWLWFRSERQDGLFNLEGDIGPFELLFDDKLVVSSLAVDAQENFFKGGHPTSSIEARTALRVGKLASQAKLRMIKGPQEWSFVLKAEDLSATSIKIPAVLSREDDDRFYERMLLLEALDEVLKGLYAEFLRIRLSPDWVSRELPAMREWVATDGDGE